MHPTLAKFTRVVTIESEAALLYIRRLRCRPVLYLQAQFDCGVQMLDR